MDLVIVQIGISVVATCIVPLAAKWVDMRIELKLQGSKSELQPVLQELAVHNKESDIIHRDLERRVAVVENGHSSISDRLDDMANDLRAYREQVEKRVN